MPSCEKSAAGAREAGLLGPNGGATSNPGGTSTKIAVFEDDQELFKASIDHTAEELKPYPHVFDEFEYRKNLIVKTVEEAGYSISDFGCVAGRGGLCRPVEGGTYAVNDRMIEDFRNAVCGEHASNLGAVIAKSIGDEIGVPSFIVDPVAVDEMIVRTSTEPAPWHIIEGNSKLYARIRVMEIVVEALEKKISLMQK